MCVCFCLKDYLKENVIWFCLIKQIEPSGMFLNCIIYNVDKYFGSLKF